MARTRASGSRRNDERFATIPSTRLPRSAFNRSYSHKTTIDSGLLYPLHVDEVLPGDTVHFQPAFFARMATPLKPFMDGLHFDWQMFHCPMRLVWDNFIRMMGERPDPGDHNDYTIPQMVAPAAVGHLVGSLSDYLTLPTDVPDYTHSTMWHRMYNLVFREWYRDENLTDPPVVDVGDGPDTSTDYVLLRRGKRKDYFTGALPFAQKGTAMPLPLGTSAPILGTVAITGTGPPEFAIDTGNIEKLTGASASTNVSWDSVISGSGGDADWSDPNLIGSSAGLTADLANATAATINEMRVAISMQQLLERDARGGTRYREMVLSHFGVQTDDIRLLRPELLLTGSTPINPTPVAQTIYAQSGLQTVFGDLAAFVTAQAVGRGFVKTFSEHGMLMLIGSVRADLSYQQGLNRMFSRLTRVDHFFPDLAHIGEQAVLSREIYTDGTGDPVGQTGDFSVWGFQPRYEEYRHRQSVITGEFRSTFAQSLDIWHAGLDFATRPVLNNAFIEENPPISRLITVVEEPEFLLDCYFKIRHVRPMPQYSVPGLLRI